MSRNSKPKSVIAGTFIRTMSTIPQFETVAGRPLTPEQKNYLKGFFAGLASKGITFGDCALADHKSEDDTPLILEERIKKEEHPLDSYYRLAENAKTNKAPDKEEVFRFKWNGLFYLTPVKDAFMARLRIPGGQLKSFQLREIAAIAKELTSGYIQVTTRANLQIRLIEPKNAPEFLHRIQAIGLHTRGTGADNIRNLTSNPTAGIDTHEIMDCTPYVQELAQFIINHREFYDLPRKFNIAFDGGGLIGSVEDTNDIGVKAVRLGDEIVFRVAVGGATGHKAFARDLGIVVPPSEIVKVVVALVRVYIANGNRSDRKKARLKHLLEKWTLDEYLAQTESLLGRPLARAPLDPDSIAYPFTGVPHSHIGVYPQKQPGLHYLGVALPVGQLTPKQLIRIAEIAELYGTGEIRLTVWQNFIIPNIPTAFVETVKKDVRRFGLDWIQSNLASGVIACTGNKYCKFSSTDTKGHALALIKHLEHRIELDVPVNIHFTGCPNSCAQHYMGDIGLLGAKTRDGREAYHLCLGGGFGKHQAVGRQVFSAVSFDELKPLVEKILRVYLSKRAPGESFQSFTVRHDLNALQSLFSE
jgi:ferredoxin-nitrite reductase